jgi:hypothetical protein
MRKNVITITIGNIQMEFLEKMKMEGQTFSETVREGLKLLMGAGQDPQKSKPISRGEKIQRIKTAGISFPKLSDENEQEAWINKTFSSL